MTAPDHPVWQFLAALPIGSLPLADGEVPMTAELSFRIVTRAIHIVCAIMLGGGIFYMRSVLSYSGPDACFAGRRQVWARWVAIASTLLLVTGFYNYYVIIQQAKIPGAKALPPTYHAMLGVKMLLGLAVMFIAAITSGKTASAEKARANMSWWLNIGWTCVMTIVILGAMLREMH
jgi:putative copper export protein